LQNESFSRDLEYSTKQQNIIGRQQWRIDSIKSTLFILIDHQSQNINFIANQTKSSFVEYSWLILYPSNLPNDSEITKTIQTDLQQIRQIEFDSRIYVADVFRNNNELDLKLFEVYRKSEKGELIVKKIEQPKTYFPKFGKNDESFIWNRRKDLTGVHFRVLFTPYNPYIIFENEVS
jgi:hypothetical protein